MVSINASTVGDLGDEEKRKKRERARKRGRRELNTWMTTRDFRGTGGGGFR
jgi:hypothetical protein